MHEAVSATALTPLETAMLNTEDSVEGRRSILQQLFNSRVYVVLDQNWDGRSSLPSLDTHVLLVSDGQNTQQTMLALFTSADKVKAIPLVDTPFKYPVEVDAAWALLGIPKNAGVLINPNSAPGFRILPGLAAELREIAKRNLENLMQRALVERVSGKES